MLKIKLIIKKIKCIYKKALNNLLQRYASGKKHTKIPKNLDLERKLWNDYFSSGLLAIPENFPNVVKI